MPPAIKSKKFQLMENEISVQSDVKHNACDSAKAVTPPTQLVMSPGPEPREKT